VPRGKKNTPNRLWQATTAGVRRTVQVVKKAEDRLIGQVVRRRQRLLP
jgi:hypothetical protein